jgi:hypothetical protein
MEENIIYNIRNEIIDLEVYLFFGALLFLASGLIYYNFYKSRPEKRIEACWNGLLLLLISGMMIAWQATKDFKEHILVSRAYKNVEVKQIEGFITKNAPSEDNDHHHNFSIDDMTFHYSMCFTGCGNVNKIGKKGAIIRESSRARISYINFNDRNIIMQMELVD